MSVELIVRHFVPAQVLRDNLPRFNLQIGVPEQNAVKVKDYALVPHAEQAPSRSKRVVVPERTVRDWWPRSGIEPPTRPSSRGHCCPRPSLTCTSAIRACGSSLHRFAHALV